MQFLEVSQTPFSHNMAQDDRRYRFRVVYKQKSWLKALQLKKGDFDKVYHDLCSYAEKRSKLAYGTQCHITINNNVIYSSDDLKAELEKPFKDNVDVIVNVCHVIYEQLALE